jgi:acyl-CoA synthetase (AMP-forming)/AMP-acid ligase II
MIAFVMVFTTAFASAGMAYGTSISDMETSAQEIEFDKAYSATWSGESVEDEFCGKIVTPTAGIIGIKASKPSDADGNIKLDLMLYNEYGELVFVSRKDYQIKHMGHRIELGEIEVNVNMLEEIKLSGCIYDNEKGKIVLYYVGDMETGELTKVLREKLPRYMIPNYVEKLNEMPLTPNGKINRVFLKEKYKSEH